MSYTHDCETGCQSSSSSALEEQSQFARRALGRIGAVDQVERIRHAKVAADGAGLGLGSERRAHHLARNRDRILARQRQHDDRRAGHELHQARDKTACPCAARNASRPALRDLHELRADDLQALLFKSRDDFADEMALNGVGLEDDERAFHERLQCRKPGWGLYPREGRRQVDEGTAKRRDS